MNQDSIYVKRFKVLKRLDGAHQLSDSMFECVFPSCFSLLHKGLCTGKQYRQICPSPFKIWRHKWETILINKAEAIKFISFLQILRNSRHRKNSHKAWKGYHLNSFGRGYLKYQQGIKYLENRGESEATE